MAVHAGFVVEKWQWDRIFSLHFNFPFSIISPPILLHTHVARSEISTPAQGAVKVMQPHLTPTSTINNYDL
jgi:hypothetical protein